MTKELTPKQEAFCLAYIETGNATRAYRMAYDADAMKDASIWTEACQLMQHPHVTHRIEKLQSQYAELHKVTVETITRELSEAQEIARTEGQAGAFVSATLGKAKIHGLLVKQLKVGTGDKTPKVNITINRDDDPKVALEKFEAIREAARAAK